MACYIRDGEGEIVAMGLQKRGRWGGTKMEEVKEIFFGLRVAWECGYRRVELESDCLGVIQKINKLKIKL